MFIIVLLPEPDGPTIARKSPRCTSRSTDRSAGTVTWPMSYVRLMSRRLMIGGSTITA